jgi:anti-anti-sigma factor
VTQLGTGSVEIEQREGNRVEIALTGEFDMANVGPLERVIHEALGEKNQLLIDLERVTFMDSQMLHLLVRLHHELGARRGVLRLHPNLNVRQLLELSGLSRLFEITDEGAPES